MSLLRIDPFRGFESLSRRMNDFANDFEGGITIEKGGFNPRIDIAEDEKSLNVHAELAGLKKEDVKIKINDENVLSISGEREIKEEHKDKNYMRSEIRYGSFHRSFILPENINSDDIQANFGDGILEIKIAKKEPEKPKEINIDIN
jgi:HSP20 family protein